MAQETAPCYICGAQQIPTNSQTTSQLSTMSRGHQINPVNMGGTATPCMGFPTLFQPQDHVPARATEKDFLSSQKLPWRW